MQQEQHKRKPGRPKASGSSHTMTQILRTASYLFMEHGYEKVSLVAVAKACGLTKASVYYYFNNKAVLFTECLLLVLKIAHDQTAAIMSGPGSLQDRLLTVAQRFMSNAHIEFESMMREASTELTEEQVCNIRAAEQSLHTLLEEVFRRAIDEGEIAPCDPKLLSHVYTALLTVRNRKEVINERKSVDQSAEEIVQLLWRGLAPRQ
ncbi:TetR/AcrR family transcriptional regulator [Paenibacillus sp. J5C_2022]|uniref:TetR/AcrR family transcriptional regulator n=1 Tax=Paenibacillus sp. J5C2022 TaxID=2977129 RepID=UPI0021D1287B|nr:TetR/AcrR family transcriptional regulator [Paenibacillus sp. J5C2022]MCU6707232.1 TetR/AcrR family transcriptional regulator [Paenibacillus sp. J5C2022]